MPRRAIATARRFVLAALAAALIPACATQGSLYVGHPQVHTRERLVEERHGEVEWMRAELKKTDDLKPTFQGFRDYATFTGIVSQLKAGYSSTQPQLARLDQDIEATKRKTELANRELDLYKAQKELEKAKAGEAFQNPPAATTSTTPTSATPGIDAPLGKGRQGIPDNANPDATKAALGDRDLYRQKLALRNEINGDIRATQLDDSHDLMGFTLYQLTFQASLVPGDNSSQYAQITLDINPYEEGPDRERSLLGLYRLWKNGLRERILREILRLQAAYEVDQKDPGTLSQRDAKFLKEYVTEFHPVLQHQLQEQKEAAVDLVKHLDASLKSSKEVATTDTQLQAATGDARSRFLDFVQTYQVYVILNRQTIEALDAHRAAKNRTDEATLLQKLKDSMQSLGNMATPKSAPQQDEVVLAQKAILKIDTADKPSAPALKAIAWAVWSKYRFELARLVHIGEPVFEDSGRIKPGDGLRIESVPSTTSDAEDLVKRFPNVPRLPKELGLRDTGEVTFITRLEKIEQRVHALTVEPKEYSQNISDVGARESLVNLSLALKASFPTAGVTAESETQFVKQTQQIIHAVTRRPLLVGFGQGRRKFGWVLGPKFVVNEAEDGFLHTPVRHDCSAAIVVPAWWTVAKLGGTFEWVEENGERKEGAAKNLWPAGGDNGTQITIELPMAADAFEKLTQALAAHSFGTEFFWKASRPRPSILRPLENKAPQNMVRAGKGRTLLVVGKDLWRSPQVYLGNQKADRVEITSHMDGLYAYFNDLKYPDGPTEKKDGADVDLVVTTTYGEARKEAAVRILPEEAVKSPIPAATLTPVEVAYRANNTTEASLVLQIKKSVPKPLYDGYDALASATTKKEVKVVLSDGTTSVEFDKVNPQEGASQFVFTLAPDQLNAKYADLKKLTGWKASRIEIQFTDGALRRAVRTVLATDEAKDASVTFSQLAQAHFIAGATTTKYTADSKDPRELVFKLSLDSAGNPYTNRAGLKDELEKATIGADFFTLSLKGNTGTVLKPEPRITAKKDGEVLVITVGGPVLTALRNDLLKLSPFKGTIEYKHNGAPILIPVVVDDKGVIQASLEFKE